MDIEAWRVALYPLGFVASACFGSRFLMQWISSEARGESHVTPNFWRLSVAGNLLMWLHGLIQVQFHLCVIQGFNLITSTRNLQLMQANRRQAPLWQSLCLFPATLATNLLFFSLRPDSSGGWLRSPFLSSQQLSWQWHLMGCLGMLLFALRFWVQWWQAERKQESRLSPAFWWLSLSGGLVSMVYFLPQADIVHILGYGTGLIPYLRNLMLLANSKRRFA